MPDYEIFVPRRKVVVEIKEVVPNRIERQAERDLANGISTVVSLKPGARVRHKISNAVPQLKARCKGRFPGLLVLMDTGIAAEHTGPYNIRVAMYGFETFVLSVPANPGHPATLVDKKFGGSRKMTRSSNTSVSAIAVMRRVKQGIDFRVYHNAYAAIPLSATLLSKYALTQFALLPKQPGSVPAWQAVP